MKDFRKSLIIGISVITGSFLLYGIINYFLSGAIAAEAVKISSERTSIRNRSDLIQGLAEQKARSPEVDKYQKAIDLILPQKDDLVNFSGWIDGLARTHNVGATFYFTGEAVPSSGSQPGYIMFSMSASGAYGDLEDFLRDIEINAPRYMVALDNLDMKRGDNNYNFVSNGRIFFR